MLIQRVMEPDAAIVWGHAPSGCSRSPLGASGRVTVTRMDVADGGVAGDFDLLLQNGDRIKGTFDAPMCGQRGAGSADAGCH